VGAVPSKLKFCRDNPPEIALIPVVAIFIFICGSNSKKLIPNNKISDLLKKPEM
jgi:hypothetical protein